MVKIAKVESGRILSRNGSARRCTVEQWQSLAKYSKGIDLLRYTLFSNGKVWLGCARPCEGKVMRDAAVQWLCIVALCEGKGWLCAVEMQRVTMLRHRTDMSRKGTVRS